MNTPATEPSDAVTIMEALMAKLYAVAEIHNDRSCDYDVCKEVRDAVSYIQQNAALAAAVGGERDSFERWVSKRHGCSTQKWEDSGKYTSHYTRGWWECWKAAQATPAAPVGGFVVVPREPTEAMFEAGFAACERQYAGEPLDDYVEKTRRVYDAMIAASPTAQPSAKDGDALLADAAKGKLCSDCPPVGDNDDCRCDPCPRREVHPQSSAKDGVRGDYTDDLAMLVRRLVNDVRALADEDGPGKARLHRANEALEFLQRNGLAGSPLRDD